MTMQDDIAAEVARQLAAQADARYIVDQIRAADDELKEELANDIARALSDIQRPHAKTFGKDAINTRYLVNGTEVSQDFYGTQVGLTGGKGQFDIVNFEGTGTQGYIDSATNARQLNVRVRSGGGADCMFDYLVSECWADEVAAGRGIEGEVRSSLTGCTFRVYSTVQAAIDHWEALPPDGAGVFFICGGTYNEDIVVTETTHEIHIYGAGADRTILGGNAGQFNAAASIDAFIHNLTLSGPAAGYSMTNAFASNMKVHCYNVIFRRKMGGDHAGSEFYNCGWEGGLSFNSAIDEPEHVKIFGGYVSAVGIDFSTTSGVRGWTVENLHFLTNSCALTYGSSVADTDLHIIFATGGGTLSKAVNYKAGGSYAGNRLKAIFRAPASTDTVINVETGVGVYNSQIHAIFDAPEAGAASSTAYIKTAGTGFFQGCEFIISFRRNSLGNYIEDLGTHQSISGDFRRCAFMITPTTAEVTLSGSSADNFFLGGVVSGSGALIPAPNDAQYVTLATDGDLTSERVLTPGLNMFATDAGANGAYTLDSWREGATVTPSAGTLTLGTDGDFFHVGAGNFSAIATPTRQLLAVLVFDGVSVVTHGASLILQGAVNFTSAAGDVLIMAHDGSGVWREINRHTAAASGGGHTIHEETGAALTARAALHFMGAGVFAQDNGGSTRTEVVVGTVYDAIVDSGDTNAAGKGNVYSTLQAAITAGAQSILFRASTDGSGITIASSDTVTRIVGDTSTGAVIPVNITCNKTGVLFDSLSFTNTRLRLGATQCRAFACIFSGTYTAPSALLNGAITSATTSIPFDNGANGGLISGHVRVDHEYFTHTEASGNATSGTLSSTAGRGQYYTRAIPHSDNAVVTDIGTGHLEIYASDCEITACFWIGCTNSDVNCAYIDGTGNRARFTACAFLSNTTFSCIAISSSNATTGDPSGIEIVGSKFSGNTTKNFLIASFNDPNNSANIHINTPKINGCSFSTMHAGAIALCMVRANIAGNTFVSGNTGANNRTNLTDFRDTAAGVLTGMATTDNAFPFDTDGGSIGTRPDMGLVEIGTELIAYAARKTGTTTGTASSGGSAPTATTLTDTGAAFTTDQYIGQVLVAGTSWGIISGNTATVFTVDSWRGGTPAGGASYAVRASYVGCVRGINGTTAAALTDNATITHRAELGIKQLQGGVATSPQANVVSGNTFSVVHTPFYNEADSSGGAAAAGASSALLTGNTITQCAMMYLGANHAMVGNILNVQTAINMLSGVNQLQAFNTAVSGGSLVYTNVPVSALFWETAGTVSGLPTGFRVPASKQVLLGATPGDATPICIPMTNRTGANSVATEVAAIQTTNDNSYINNPGAASTRVAGVQMESGVADASTVMIAIGGVVDVLCTTAAVARGDVLEISATAGQAQTSAGPVAGGILGKALTAKAAGSTGTVKCRLGA